MDGTVVIYWVETVDAKKKSYTQTASSYPIKNSSVQNVSHNRAEEPWSRVTSKIKFKNYTTSKIMVGRKRINSKNYITNSRVKNGKKKGI